MQGFFLQIGNIKFEMHVQTEVEFHATDWKYFSCSDLPLFNKIVDTANAQNKQKSYIP